MANFDSTYSILLKILDEVKQGGGGGGVTDYTKLTGKPSINDIELVGNKTLIDLGIASQADFEAIQMMVDAHDTDISENSAAILNLQNELNGVVTLVNEINGTVV